MRNLITLLVAAISLTAFGNYTTKVYNKQGGAELVVADEGKISVASGGELELLQGAVIDMADSSDGLKLQRVARATYDVSVDGGGIGDHGLGVSLPANAIVYNAYYQTKTQFTDGGSGTVALACGSATILSAGDITGQAAESVNEATIDTTAEAADVGTSECEITATVATATQTAGKLVLFVHYDESE